MKRSLRARSAVVALALSGTFIAACGSDDGEPPAAGGTGEGEVEVQACDLTVGVQPFAQMAALYVAIEENLFEEEGLTVTTQLAPGGGAGIITGIVSGDLDIGYANYVSTIEASVQGLPLRVIRDNDRPDVQALFVMPDSGITEPADLVGKTIAVNGLGNIMELTSRAALRENGVDPAQVTFVELPPPDMPAALSQGQVDAAWLPEPFVTIVTNQLGARPVLDVFEGPTEDLPVAGWVTSAQFAQENSNCVEDFRRVMDEAIAMVAADPEKVAQIIPTFTQIPPEVAADLNDTNWAEANNLEDIRQVEELMREFGIIDEEFDVEQLIIE